MKFSSVLIPVDSSISVTGASFVVGLVFLAKKEQLVSSRITRVLRIISIWLSITLSHFSSLISWSVRDEHVPFVRSPVLGSNSQRADPEGMPGKPLSKHVPSARISLISDVTQKLSSV